MLYFQCLMGEVSFQMSASPLTVSCFDLNQCAKKPKQENIKYTQCLRGQIWYSCEIFFLLGE